jgi:hypothetical protein
MHKKMSASTLDNHKKKSYKIKAQTGRDESYCALLL